METCIECMKETSRLEGQYCPECAEAIDRANAASEAPPHEKPTMLTFEQAVVELKHGHKVTREGWNGKGQYLAVQRPNADSENTLPYVYIITVGGERIPWLCSQGDFFGNDWRVTA